VKGGPPSPRSPGFPRFPTGEVLEKTVFYTKAGDHICGVGYYKE
jgi:hypothetical protein